MTEQMKSTLEFLLLLVLSVWLTLGLFSHIHVDSVPTPVASKCVHGEGERELESVSTIGVCVSVCVCMCDICNYSSAPHLSVLSWSPLWVLCTLHLYKDHQLSQAELRPKVTKITFIILL